MKRQCGDEQVQHKCWYLEKCEKRVISKYKNVYSSPHCWFWRLPVHEADLFADKTIGVNKHKNRAEVSRGEGRVVVTDPCRGLDRLQYKNALHPNIKQNAREEKKDIQLGWTKQETRQRESQKKKLWGGSVCKALWTYREKTRKGVKRAQEPTHGSTSWQEPRYSPVPCMKPARQPALRPAVPAQLA